MNTFKKITQAAILVAIVAAPSAFAAPVKLTPAIAVPSGTVQNFVLGLSNTAGFPSQNMGTLRLEQIGADTKWTLAANWDNKYNSGNPFVFGLDFAMTSGSLSQSTLPLFDVTGTVAVKSFGSSGVFFNPSNNANRFNDGEKVSWLFKSTNISNFLIKDLHVNAIYNGQSVKFAPMTPVPEPETYAMMAVGLAALVAMRRRQQKA
ncbi:MAG: PEP-CTERM sorting domain-containing protein [Burkholderiales bacterium]|nr:PEP-CTERM sorting domain-containing protein [Burkholderiales bacterium]